MKDEIRALADRYAAELKRNIDERVADMEQDDRSHVLIYEVLGISKDEGKLIDVYQNKGRFLYKYAGSFLEEAAKLCFKAKFPDSGSVRVPNTHGKSLNFLAWIVWWAVMPWKSSGAMRPQMATTSPKSIRGCRPCVMPVTGRCA
jgi:hypothetical protein